MSHQRFFILSVSLFTLAGIPAFAHSYGPTTFVTGASGAANDNPKACTQCHATSALNSGSGSVTISLAGAAVYVPGVKQRVTVTVADTGQQRWGFELTARLNGDPTKAAGDLVPIDSFTQTICEDYSLRPCATGTQFIEHTSAGTRNGQKDGASFQFDWTPPATNAGPVTFYVAGNAADGNGTNANDHIYTSSMQLTAVAPQAPTISAIVNAEAPAATSTSGNSWLTIYGANLSATTRSWQASDFVNGTFPITLDGVSVVLAPNGAPRRAYIGYVSPTQINVLLPTDTTNTSVPIQVKNTAGISTPTSVTVAANFPQLMTVDGKYVYAMHQNGTLVTKTSPAAKGETIVVFGTGMGATTPAQINGVIPTVAAPLATLPTVNVGTAAATVSAGTITPGAGGVYQLTIQVPVAAVSGDQPLVAIQGGNSTSSVLLTIQ